MCTSARLYRAKEPLSLLEDPLPPLCQHYLCWGLDLLLRMRFCTCTGAGFTCQTGALRAADHTYDLALKSSKKNDMLSFTFLDGCCKRRTSDKVKAAWVVRFLAHLSA